MFFKFLFLAYKYLVLSILHTFFFMNFIFLFFLKGRTSNLGIHAVSNRPLKEKKLNDDYNKVEKIILCTLNILLILFS